MNAIVRGDLRFRLSSAKAVAIHTVFLIVLALLAFLSLPPELGRLDDLRQEGLLLAFLVVEAVLVAYFTSASACGEIVIEGEKSVWDLAASPFPAGGIAAAKVLTSGAFAAVMLVIATPFLAIVAGIRGESMSEVARAAVVAIPFATAMGALGTLYGVVFESDFARSFVHWLTLLALVVGGTVFPSPWDLISPVRGIVVAVRTGLSPGVLLEATGYLVMAVAAAVALRSRVEAIRREAQAS